VRHTGLARTYDFTTKCPHGLRAGDFVRFRDLENHSQNAEPVMVSGIDSSNDKAFSITEPSHSMFIQPKKGSYIHLQPRFFPFQKLQQTTQLLSGTGRTKCLIVSKNPLRSRQAAWIETEAGSEKLRFKSGGDDTLTKLFPVDVRVDCACFLPESRVEGHLGETFIALGCTERLENKLYIYYRNRGGADFLKPCDSGTDVVLPAFTRFTPLPSDDAVHSDSVSPDSRSFVLVAATKLTQVNESAFFLHVTVETGVAPPTCKVKCFRSINEIRPTVSASKKPISNTPLRSTHPTFSSLDVIPIRSKAHNIDDSWLYFRDLRTKYITANHRVKDEPLELESFEQRHVPPRKWEPQPAKQFLDALKQEQHFIQFLRPGLCERLFSIEPVANDTGTSSFYVSTAGMLKFPVPPGEHTFRVVVASDIDGEYGHDSGIAKFAFLLDSSGASAGAQFGAKTRLFAVPLRSWFPKLVQGKFGNNLQ